MSGEELSQDRKEPAWCLRGGQSLVPRRVQNGGGREDHRDGGRSDHESLGGQVGTCTFPESHRTIFAKEGWV